MSAYTVSDAQVSAILQGVYGTDYRGFNVWRYLDDKEPSQEQFGIRSKAQAEANELMKENIRSVNWRYRNSEHAVQGFFGNVQLNFAAEQLEPLQVLKLIDCLAYQSCESDDWQSTEAYKLLNEYREKVVRKLAGYDNLKWSI